MSTLPHAPTDSERPPWPVVASGLVALAVAMGIGRFAFTPLMPLMMRDGTLTAAAGAEWAAANYGGYLVGALTASWFAGNPRRGLLLSLAGVALTTVAMAAVGHDAPAALGAGLRALAGVFSAWALVCASGWCLAELARRRVGALGAWIYTGVGSGIALAGTLAWLGGIQPASRLWLELGLVAALGALLVWSLSRGQGTEAAGIGEREAAAVVRRPRNGQAALVLCYGVFGFGYIVPATFLPAMARELASDPRVFGLTWPLFGLAAALSVAAVARWSKRVPRQRLWAAAQGVMALGTGLPLAAHALWAVAASAILVGGTFMVATMAGLQLAREARPDNPTPLLARMTAAFAAGQIVGPVLVRLLGPGRRAGWDALDCTGAVATMLLVLTALWLWRAARPSAESLVPA
ncbi:putative MFS family arabinose efflux permease [Methylobacterium brachiatum]|uniref:MFS family arabinose efflux permease n=1 Tax=Methylobacterium brachiatum TaxID=269660 RepID=A0AAJ1TUA5_9HYPH|nr:YbfB/YjiJ family MFS transporter [Methylobacterium brachiatum]MCB4802858.1 YbfB/YjiJ family MFS transporter [Methylobacterium brachiatum]MDQ0543497.1 putative MFS family arabinose efflux permease [Methylobacterium brachiatum]